MELVTTQSENYGSIMCQTGLISFIDKRKIYRQNKKSMDRKYIIL